MRTPNLTRIFDTTSIAIECTTHALSTVYNIRLITGQTPQSSDTPNPIDEFVYVEGILTETLHHLQSARKNLLLLGVNFAEKTQEVPTNQSEV